MAYKKGDYAKYHKSPRMKKERALRNKNRYHAEKAGRVKKGDGKHIDHKDGNPRNSVCVMADDISLGPSSTPNTSVADNSEE